MPRIRLPPNSSNPFVQRHHLAVCFSSPSATLAAVALSRPVAEDAYPPGCDTIRLRWNAWHCWSLSSWPVPGAVWFFIQVTLGLRRLGVPEATL